MRFSYNPETHSGTSGDGRYTIELRGERYGKFLNISFGGELVKTVWVRENQRPVLPMDAPPLHEEKTVLGG